MASDYEQALRQWQAVTGKRLSASELGRIRRGELQAELGTKLQREMFSREAALRERQLKNQEKEAKRAQAGNIVSGAVQTAYMYGYGAKEGMWPNIFKGGSKPAVNTTTSGLAPVTTTPATSTTPAWTQGGISGIDYTNVAGTQTPAVQGGTQAPVATQAGQQAAPVATQAASGSQAYTGAGGAGLKAGWSPGVTYAASGAAGAGAGLVVGPYGAKAGESRVIQSISPWGGKKTERKAGATLAGASAGFGAGFMVGGPVGGVVGLVAGGASAYAQESSVICSEMYRQKLINHHTRQLDNEYANKFIDQKAYDGYVRLATPIVAKMKKSKFFTSLVVCLAKPTAYEMASRMDSRRSGSLIGKLVLWIGLPICRKFGGKK